MLLDGRFDPLPGVVAEGRRVIANIKRVSKLFLRKTAYSIAIAVSLGMLNLQFPFLPRQLSFTDGLTIGIPSFFLALMANTSRYRPGFLRRSLSCAIPAGLIVTASLLALNLYAQTSGTAEAAPETLQSASVLTLSVIGLWILAVVSRPLNAKKLAVVLTMFASLLILLNLPPAQDFFHLAWPPADLLRAAGAAAVCGGLAIELLARIHGRKFPADRSAAPVVVLGG